MTGKTELMARPLRIAFRGELYLVTSRSDGRDDIYFSDQVQRLDVLVHVCERFNFSEPVASLIMGVGQKTRPLFALIYSMQANPIDPIYGL